MIWQKAFVSEASSATIAVSITPPRKKIRMNSNGVSCFPGRRPTIRTMNTRKKYPNSARSTDSTEINIRFHAQVVWRPSREMHTG